MRLLENAAGWAWETSWAACALIIPALLLQIALRKPALTPLRHALGLLIVARLLLPFSPESSFSIFNWIGRKEAATSRSFASAGAVETEAPAAAKLDSTELTTKPAPKPPISAIKWLSLIWAAGAAGMLVRVALQHSRIRRWMRAAQLIETGPVAEALASARQMFNSGRTIRVFALAEMSAPAVFGVFSPAILLPRELAETGDIRRLRLIFLHELAHVRRFDALINWLMIVAQALHWFNPLAWVALRRLRAEQELLCDADVMRRIEPGEHRAYGETLLAVASRSGAAFSTLVPISTGFKHIKERIAMITEYKPGARRVMAWLVPPAALVVALFTFTAAAENKPATETPAPENRPAVENTPSAEPAPLARGSGETGSGKQASNITKRQLEALRREVERMNGEIEARQERLDKLGEELGIVQPNEDDAPDTSAIERLRAELFRTRQEAMQFRRLHDSLEEMKPEKLRQALPTAHRDEALDRLLSELGKSEQESARIQKQFSEKHPEILQQAAAVKELNKQIDDRVAGIMEGLRALYQSRQQVAESLAEQIEAQRMELAQMRRQSRPYYSLKRDIETMRKARDQVYLRLLEEEVESRIPKRVF